MANKKTIKGELGKIYNYPVFEFIVQGELKKVITLDDAQKVLEKALSSQRQEIIEKIEKGGYIIGKREGDAFKEEDIKEIIK